MTIDHGPTDPRVDLPRQEDESVAHFALRHDRCVESVRVLDEARHEHALEAHRPLPEKHVILHEVHPLGVIPFLVFLRTTKTARD